MTAAAGSAPPQRVRRAHVEWVAERLSERDRAVIASVDRLRLATALHLERLHFFDLPDSSRARTRRRVLARLVAWRVLMPLDRRVGGVRAGSAGLTFALDSAGQWLAQLDAHANGGVSIRRPGPPGLGFVAHTLSVSELYVALVELARDGDFTVADFRSEPAAWRPNGLGGWLKPDAYVRLGSSDFFDDWWIEADRATEHLPTIRRKLLVYLDFVSRGQQGPNRVIPRLLVMVPSIARREELQRLIQHLPEPAGQLFHVTLASDAPKYLARILRE